MKTILRVLLSITAAVTANVACAQDMSMHHMRSENGKQIFLRMMDTMMTNMERVGQFTSADADFLQQMIPHHEGAVAMAKYEIAYGKNFEMVQLAKSILAEQNIEIDHMHIWLKNTHVKTSEPTGYEIEMGKTMNDMMANMPENDGLKDIDRAFAAVMLPHHQAAIDMARVALKYSGDKTVAIFAQHLISSEEVEIEQMHQFLKKQ